MSKPQRRFGKEFEAEAVRLVETSGRTQREIARTWALVFRPCVAGSTSVAIARWRRRHPNARRIWRRS